MLTLYTSNVWSKEQHRACLNLHARCCGAPHKRRASPAAGAPAETATVRIFSQKPCHQSGRVVDRLDVHIWALTNCHRCFRSKLRAEPRLRRVQGKQVSRGSNENTTCLPTRKEGCQHNREKFEPLQRRQAAINQCDTNDDDVNTRRGLRHRQ